MTPRTLRRLKKIAVLYAFAVLPLGTILIASAMWEPKVGALNILPIIIGFLLTILCHGIIGIIAAAIYTGARFLVVED